MRPKWGQVRAFCRAQGYRETRTDHYYYDKVLSDRSTSGTKVSFGKDADEVPPELWKRVWSLQLRLKSEAEFWTGLEGSSVEYTIPPAPQAADPLPAYLLRFLRDTLHYSDDQIDSLGREQAQDLLNAHYAGTLQGRLARDATDAQLWEQAAHGPEFQAEISRIDAELPADNLSRWDR